VCTMTSSGGCLAQSGEEPPLEILPELKVLYFPAGRNHGDGDEVFAPFFHEGRPIALTLAFPIGPVSYVQSPAGVSHVRPDRAALP
jgi:hypothetical protein